ncbi:MAG: glycoside hydrolase family 13 protein [Sphaerochaetaceae bacterium]|nr:glycoside hydrolase family 13 protein [Sphaerochaetaceae bacterium]
MLDINNYFDFNISRNFVAPLYPKKGEEVKINIIGLSDLNFVRLNYKKNGSWDSLILNIEKKLNNELALYSGNFIIEEDTLLNFTFERNLVFYNYSKRGVSVFQPCDNDSFEIKVDIEAPLWPSNSVCYQIFPDRFRNGNPEIGVKDNQYEFDGALTIERNFDQPPLEFEKGRCVDFYNGDLKGVEDSLNYLKSLGVNCIYLNPIGVSKTTHRYDCCDFFHVDPNLGGDEALISLIDAAHKQSIKVIVDISINHTGIEHPWFKTALNDKKSKEAAYYYIDENNNITFWQGVKTLPQLNYNNQELRDLMYRDENSVIKKFLKPPFNQDGWRFDVADEVGRKDNDQFNDEIWREVRKSIKEENPNAYILAESWIDSSDHLQGDQWDATMNYIGCSRPIRRWMGEEDRFTCNNWGHSPRKVNEYSEMDLTKALEAQLDSIPAQMAQFQMNLIDSHDTPRLHNNTEVFDWNNYKGAIILMYTLPGMPSVYYGDEIGIAGAMGSVEMSRYPMQWDENKWNKDFYSLYKTLGTFRSDYNNVLYLSSYKLLNLDDNLFVLARYNSQKVIFSILNKNDKEMELDLDIPYLTLDKVEKSVFDTKVVDKKVYLNPKENALIIFTRK